MVERIREGWAKWLISGIPVMLALVALIFSSGARLNSIDSRLTALERMDTRIGNLEQQVQSLQLQVQELKDDLRDARRIINYEQPRRGYNSRNAPHSDQAYDPTQ
jgi:hypothetical protein